MFPIVYSVLPVYRKHYWLQRCYAESCTLRVTTPILRVNLYLVVAISEQILTIKLELD